jgi:hypothetical protein
MYTAALNWRFPLLVCLAHTHHCAFSLTQTADNPRCDSCVCARIHRYTTTDGNYTVGFTCHYDSTVTSVPAAVDAAMNRTTQEVEFCLPILSPSRGSSPWTTSTSSIVGPGANASVESLVSDYNQIDWAVFGWSGPSGDHGTGARCKTNGIKRMQFPHAISDQFVDTGAERLYSCDGCAPCINETTTSDSTKHYNYMCVRQHAFRASPFEPHTLAFRPLSHTRTLSLAKHLLVDIHLFTHTHSVSRQRLCPSCVLPSVCTRTESVLCKSTVTCHLPCRNLTCTRVTCGCV